MGGGGNSVRFKDLDERRRDVTAGCRGSWKGPWKGETHVGDGRTQEVGRWEGGRVGGELGQGLERGAAWVGEDGHCPERGKGTTRAETQGDAALKVHGGPAREPPRCDLARGRERQRQGAQGRTKHDTTASLCPCVKKKHENY